MIAAILLASVTAASGARASEAEVRLKRLPSASYEVVGGFTVAASTAAVWGVLTDYENMPSFVASMKSSRMRETRADGSLLVEQKATGEMFFLARSVTLLLEVRREAQSLSFDDVGRESFWIYEGSWSAETTPDGTRVTYRLIAQPDFIAPSFGMSRALKRGARNLLNQVRDEIMRRTRRERGI